ncbi:MAG: PhnD/SsuA/transferrin family substrate-binding protein [Deferribacterales bacterium]
MKRFLFIILLAVVVPAGAKTSPLVYSPVIKDKVETSAKIHEPFIRMIARKSGLDIKTEYNLENTQIVNAFEMGKVDIAYLGPLPLLEIERKYPYLEKVATLLSPEGTPSYSCSIIAMKDGASSLKDFRGTIALTKPLSTCGRFNAFLEFSKLNREIDSVDYYYSGNHTSVVLDVLLGKAQTGSLQTAIAKSYEFQGIKIISTSEPYPGFTIVANTKTMSRDEIDRLKNAILSFDPVNDPQDAKDAKQMDYNFKYGAVPADEAIFSRMKKEFMLYNKQ